MASHPWHLLSRLAIPALCALLLSAAGCGSSSSVSVAPTSVNRCGITVTRNGTTVPATGGTGTVSVSAERECSWSARSDSPWIALTNAQGQGPATITYSVQPNPNATTRRASVVVDDQSVEIAQEAAPCRYDVAPSSANVPAAGGAVPLAISAPGGCPWTAQSGVPWISTAPGSGQGGGTVQVNVAPNTTAARTGTLTVAGRIIQLQQAGVSQPPPPPSEPTCSYRLKPDHVDVNARGDVVQIEVKAKDGCGWAASSPVPWVTITDGRSGSGDGEVRIRIEANSGPARAATLTIAGQPFAVSQDAKK